MLIEGGSVANICTHSVLTQETDITCKVTNRCSFKIVGLLFGCFRYTVCAIHAR